MVLSFSVIEETLEVVKRLWRQDISVMMSVLYPPWNLVEKNAKREVENRNTDMEHRYEL
jgi:hypothetical protein